jgi:hypothetical protein
LNGKRELNVRQICKLAKRFHVAPAAFLPRDERSPSERARSKS